MAVRFLLRISCPVFQKLWFIVIETDGLLPFFFYYTATPFLKIKHQDR
jgi:hypothetical protein